MIYDVIIIGSGVAGLSYAINLPKNSNALIICKGAKTKSNTYMAQGGVAVAKDENDLKTHISDTLSVGGGLNDAKAVQILCEIGYEAVNELIAKGLKFDLAPNGELALTKEAGHSTNRILHANGDATGRGIADFLLSACPFEIKENLTVIDLLIDKNYCYGITVLDDKGKMYNIYAHKVVIASGGVGSLYKFSTNEPLINGLMHGICAEKNLELQDMHLMQFHPTVFIKDSEAFLLSEALRGEGATLVDEQNERFAFSYDERGELAPRDALSRAISFHISKGHQTFLAFNDFEPKAFAKRFPTVYTQMALYGYNLPQDKVPVRPAFHYSIGGIKCDLSGRVCNMENLFTIGESASFRVHGANRLASNSLLEGLAFGKIAANTQTVQKGPKTFDIINEPIKLENDAQIKNELRKLLWQNVGVTRTTQELKDAQKQIQKWLNEPIGRIIKLELLTAKEIVAQAIKAPTSIGAHFVKD